MIPNYNPYFNQQNYQMMQNQTAQSPFISVRSEAEARNYPVAYGNSVTFKDETAPYVYCKTMFSQFDKPSFEKYRLIKEDSVEEAPKKTCGCEDIKVQVNNLEEQISSLWKEIEGMKERKRGRSDEHTRNGKSVQTKSDDDALTEV